MSKSEQHLMEAFAGESQANRKYLAFAKKADAEGHSQAAKLFRAAAEAETVHAHAHLRVLKGINSTAENMRCPARSSRLPEPIAESPKSTPISTRKHWTPWRIRLMWSATMSARFAVIPVKTKPQMNARCARPKPRLFSGLIDEDLDHEPFKMPGVRMPEILYKRPG